jgi:hypothetical protein
MWLFPQVLGRAHDLIQPSCPIEGGWKKPLLDGVRLRPNGALHLGCQGMFEQKEWGSRPQCRELIDRTLDPRHLAEAVLEIQKLCLMYSSHRGQMTKWTRDENSASE